MINLLFSDVCNLSCNYCFAKEAMGSSGSAKQAGDRYLPLENLAQVLDFLEASETKVFSILGGEPTLHPQFIPAMEMILSRGFRVQIYSNGVMRNETRDFLAQCSPARIHLLLNANHPSTLGGKLASFEKTLNVLARKLSLVYTISEPEFDPAHVLGLFRDYPIQKQLRIKLSVPIFGEENRYLSHPETRRASESVVKLIEDCAASGIRSNFGCGVSKCTFTESQLKRLDAVAPELRFFCSPALDIGVDLAVWHCFALSAIGRRKLGDFRTLGEMLESYARFAAPFQGAGSKFDCRTCKYMKDQSCSGGCMSNTMTAFAANTPGFASLVESGLTPPVGKPGGGK